MPVSVLSAHPANKVIIDEVEARKRTSIEVGARLIKSGLWIRGRGRPDVSEIGDRYSASSDSEMDVGAPRATNLVARPASGGSEESPEVGKDAND
jgi:hypothetical protein